MPDPPPIRVLIATAGSLDVLQRSLQSISECDIPASHRGLLVIENGKQRGAKDIVQEFCSSVNASYLFEPTPSKTAALNRALSTITENELIVFFDDDVRVSKDILFVYSEAARLYPNGFYFGGPTGVDYEQMPPPELKQFLPPSAIGIEFPPDLTEIQYPCCFLGFNWAAFADDLKATGGFNAKLGPGMPISAGDESFMQYALNRRGLVGRSLADAKVWHWVPRDRCSENWILSRAYPSGYTSGMFAAHYACQKQQCFGLVRSLRKSIDKRLKRIRIRTLRLGILVTARYASGFVAGYRYSRSHHPFDARSGKCTSERCESDIA